MSTLAHFNATETGRVVCDTLYSIYNYVFGVNNCMFLGEMVLDHGEVLGPQKRRTKLIYMFCSVLPFVSGFVVYSTIKQLKIYKLNSPC